MVSILNIAESREPFFFFSAQLAGTSQSDHLSNATGSINLVLQTSSALIALFMIFLGEFKPIVREFLNIAVSVVA